MSTVESHLASNVNKSRLVQKDLQVAKKLQEEEDHRAKVQGQKQHTDLYVSLSLTHRHTPTHRLDEILYLPESCYQVVLCIICHYNFYHLR